jgi:hypothetical protein
MMAPQEEPMPAEQRSFAARLGETSFVSHGGVLLTAAAWTRAAHSRQTSAPSARNSSDRLMAQFARHRGPLLSGRRTYRMSDGLPQPFNHHS